MLKAIKYLINILFLISFFICAVSFRNKLVVIFYLQAIFNMSYDAFQLQMGSLCHLIIDAGYCHSVTLRNRIFLHLLIINIKVSSKASKNCTIFKFDFLHCLLMLLFLLSNSLNAIYLNLSKIDISIINVYPVNLMYVVILFWE